MVTMQLIAALDVFLAQLQADGRALNTRLQLHRHVRALSTWALQEGLSSNVAEFSSEVLARFLASSQARLRSDGEVKQPGSMNALRSNVRAFFSFLAKSGTIATDPSRLIRRARDVKRPPRALSPEQARRLLDVLAEADGQEAVRDATLFRLMLHGGLRLGAAVALDIRDLDLEQGHVLVRRSKRGGAESVLLSRAVVEDLRAFVADRAHGPVFLACGERRVSPRHIQRRLQLWLNRAGIRGRFSPHSLRHSFAQKLYRETGDLLLLKRALGHRSVSATTVYAQCDDDRLRAAIG